MTIKAPLVSRPMLCADPANTAFELDGMSVRLNSIVRQGASLCFQMAYGPTAMVELNCPVMVADIFRRGVEAGVVADSHPAYRAVKSLVALAKR